LRFVANDEMGHAIVIDTKKEVGGTESGFQPVDLLLVALGGCMSFDIVSILKKMRADLRFFKVTVEATRATEHPKRYTDINVYFETNPEVKDEDLKKAFELSRDKYCSVLWTLKIPPTVNFHFKK
ncbi:MAG: OsmC family protein, partial [candidate division WOR-3 bacterium]|nr:OsmC family protein [candidate division WOR-3 bacterium]